MKSKSNSIAKPIPPALKKTLEANPEAKAAFDKLSYSHQKEYVNWIGDAKQEETMKRRLKQLIPMLLARKNSKA